MNVRLNRNRVLGTMSMRVFGLLIPGVLLLGTPNLLAQHEAHHPESGRADRIEMPARQPMNHDQSARGTMMPMHGHVQAMGDMPHNPLFRYGMLVRLIPDMQDSLGLSEDQSAALQDERERFQASMDASVAALTNARQQFDEMLTSEMPEPAIVESHLQEMSRLRAEQQLLTYATARRMIDLLNDEQRAWIDHRGMADLKGHMMAHDGQHAMMHAMNQSMMTPGECMAMSGGQMMGGHGIMQQKMMNEK